MLGFKGGADAPLAVADDDLAALADLLQVLASPARLALLAQLQRPRGVGELVVQPTREDEGLSPERPLSRQAVERHLDILVQAGLVTWREPEGGSRNKQFVLHHARLFAAVEELRALTRLRATTSSPEETIPLKGTQAPPPDPDAVAGPRFVLLRGVPEWRVLPVPEGESALGRGSDVPLRLDHDPFVSGRHCILRRDAAGVELVDAGASRNGTSLNGRRLEGKVRLRRGHVVGVGRSLLLYLDG